MRNQLGSVVIALVLGFLPMQMMVCESISAQTKFEQLTLDRKKEILSLLRTASVFLKTGEYKKALETIQKALVISQSINDQYGIVSSLQYLGRTYYLLGQIPKSISYYNQALETARQFESNELKIDSLIALASIYDAIGQYQKSINYSLEALNILKQINARETDIYKMREVGFKMQEVDLLNKLGKAYNRLGEYQKAINLHLQTLEIIKKYSLPQHESKSLVYLGDVYVI